MNDAALERIPAEYRDAVRGLAAVLRELGGGNLLSLVAFGGWLDGDPFYAGTPARTVAVLERIDLDLLDRLARCGERLGRQRLAAPLIMTVPYIQASRDAFPLELLEIREQHTAVVGEDPFVGLELARRDLRLQCERELKGELIQLRQGLLAAAGRYALLHTLCQASAARVLRVLRGVLVLAGMHPLPRHSRELVERAEQVSGCRLATLARYVAVADDLGLEGFKAYYGELAELAAHVDRLAT